MGEEDFQPVTAPIGKTFNMNYNKHNNDPVVAGKEGRVMVMARYWIQQGKRQFHNASEMSYKQSNKLSHHFKK